ncbi:MAG: hypothetical protein ABIG96_06885 [Candidatus Micrarchaeota archaeon]
MLFKFIFDIENMLLRPENIEDMVAQLRRVPKIDRRVIILVGRHLNEGTLKIAQSQHDEWQKRGAVTVVIPPKWTPTWLYYQARKEKLDPHQLAKRIRAIPTDDQVLKKIYDSGFKVPVINFHSNPDRKNKAMSVYYWMGKNSLLKPHPAVALHNWSNPNELNIEIQPFGKLKKYVWRRFPHFFKKLISGDDGKTEFSQRYVKGRVMTKAEVEHFLEVHHPQMLEIIDHLARYRLSKKYLA